MKGISPLIATVLLIAFTIAVAGIVSNFLISFSSEQSEEAVDRASEDIECASSGLFIREAVWNSSATRLSLTVRNTGRQDLQNFRMSIIRTNNTQESLTVDPSGTTMSPGDETIFDNETAVGTCNDISKIVLISSTCPNDARDEVDGSNIDSC